MNTTKNIKRILFATDGSDFSAGAQRVAIDLAKRCQGELHIMSIVLTAQDLEAVGTHHLREEREKSVQSRIDATSDAAASAGLSSTTHLVYGEEPHHEIVNTAEEIEADLIVMGRRGTRGLARLVGHATAYVAGHAPCPVLIVPREAHIWTQRVLFATDGSKHSNAAAQLAQALARQCGIPATVVSATTRSHSAERKAEAQAAIDQAVAVLTAAGLQAEGGIAEGRPDEVVLDIARQKGADVIVVGSHGRTGLLRLVLGSISERIMGQATCPVLVAPQRD